MKHCVINMLIIAVAAVVACQKQPVAEESAANDPVVKNPVVEEPQSSSYVYTINASTDDLDVKSDYDSDGKFTWSTGDAISVLFHDNTQPDELKNKFFTLTLVSGANSKTATFSGEITTGYTIGASDGDESNKKIWALFPASTQHSYTVGGDLKFYIKPETDYTSSGFSANLPMSCNLTSEGPLVFSNIVCAYKLVVKNVDASKASKIRVVVTNQLKRALSGSIVMGSGYLKMNDGDVEAGASTTISFVSNVSYDSDPKKGTAVFYVATRYGQSYFQPTIQIINYSTGQTIKSFVASKAPAALNKGEIKPITLDLSDGDYFVPAININGDMSDWTSITTGVSSSGHYKAFKVTYDEYNIYVYSKVDKVTGRFAWGGSTVYLYYGFDTDNNPDNAGSLIDSNVSHGKFESILLTYPFGGSDVSPEIRTNPNPTINGKSVTISCAGANEDTMVETEMSISRTQLGITKGDVVRIQSLGNKDIGWLPEDVVITIAK